MEREVTVSITRGLLLEQPIRTQQAVVVYIQDSGFKSSANIITKLSVNKLRWTCLLARTSNFLKVTGNFEKQAPELVIK